MLTSKQDKQFAIGLVFAIVALYSVSVYSYFSGKMVTDVAISHANGAPTAETEVGKILQVMNSEDRALFSPIGGSEAVVVPGSACVITSQNLDLKNTLHNIPVECFKSEPPTQQGE
tara:strand:- start:204 stop:551 length:348 start_codon:yes stop_codon:yes gene_type:complete